MFWNEDELFTSYEDFCCSCGEKKIIAWLDCDNKPYCEECFLKMFNRGLKTYVPGKKDI